MVEVMEEAACSVLPHSIDSLLKADHVFNELFIMGTASSLEQQYVYQAEVFVFCSVWVQATLNLFIVLWSNLSKLMEPFCGSCS